MKKQFQRLEPKKCWVGERQKICYASKLEAETAALVAEYDHGADQMTVYQCEMCGEWHLASVKKSRD